MRETRKKYRRQQLARFKRLRDTWRRPRGESSDQKRKKQEDGAHPSKSHRAPKTLRFKHPSGLLEQIVYTTSDLEGIDKEKYAVRIAGTVGKRKRTELVQKAEKLGLRILNR